MLYVFIDESGDLGFTEKSTKYYVIACVETQDDGQFERVFRKIRRKLKKSKRNIPEFKFTKTNKETKLEILSKLVELDVSFSAVVLNKRAVFSHLCTKQQILHNYIAGFMVDQLPLSHQRKIKIIIDKFLTNEHERNNFDNRILRKINETCDKYGISYPDVTVEHASSQSYPGLQVADFIAGSIFNKYERKNNEYYKIIESKIRSLKEVRSLKEERF